MTDRYLPGRWILPRIDDRNRSFFTSGALSVQRCHRCDHRQHPAADVCEKCQGFDLEDVECEPFGSVVALTWVHHAPHQLLEDALPYNVAIIELHEPAGVRIVGNVLGPADVVHIGAEVACEWATVTSEDTGEVLHLPHWSPRTPARGAQR